MNARRVLQYGGFALCLTFAACTHSRYVSKPTDAVWTGPAAAQSLERDVRRGTSTMQDVERLLGKPNGTGAMLLPSDTAPKTVWIYEHMELDADNMGTTVMQEALLVFFTRDVFDGFLWFSDYPFSLQ